MNTNPPSFNDLSKYLANLQNFRNRWGWFLALGILFIILGFIAIANAAVVTTVSVIFLGVILIISGVVQLGYAFWVRKWGGFFLSILAAILYGVTGFLLVSHPLAGEVSLTLLLAAFYTVGGLFRIIAAISTRIEQWGWALFSGIVKFALGILIWIGWPATGLWVFGLFIGIDLVFFGWFWVILSLGTRNALPPSSDS